MKAAGWIPHATWWDARPVTDTDGHVEHAGIWIVFCTACGFVKEGTYVQAHEEADALAGAMLLGSAHERKHNR